MAKKANTTTKEPENNLMEEKILEKDDLPHWSGDVRPEEEETVDFAHEPPEEIITEEDEKNVNKNWLEATAEKRKARGISLHTFSPKAEEEHYKRHEQIEEKVKKLRQREEKFISPPTPIVVSAKTSGQPAKSVSARRKIREENLKKILNHFPILDKIANDDVQELLGVSHSTATRYLKRLTRKGKITKFGRGPNTFYRKI